jgi:hypothetical protein
MAFITALFSPALLKFTVRLFATCALSKNGKIEHSHTKYTGEEAWKLKAQLPSD